MAYIWINPVTAVMYEPEILKNFLQRHGYKQYVSSTDWAQKVKEKYKDEVEQTNYPVLDMRCPKIKNLIKEEGLEGKNQMVIPDIDPILIHYGREAALRDNWNQEEILMTTPCRALANMGNELNLPHVRFMPWNEFLEELGDRPKGRIPKESPIPPGFFKELDKKTVSLSGEQEIRDYLEHYAPDGAELIEMLYCTDGCHNGDGIQGCNYK